MESNLTAEPVAEQPRQRFPYSNWGPWTAVLGVVLALGTGIVLAIPALVFGQKSNGHLDTFGNLWSQGATEAGFLGVSMAIAATRGAKGFGEIRRRLGVRLFRPSALKWMGACIGLYLLFVAVYAQVIVEPHQEDIAEALGPIAAQVLLIAILAPIAEEVCFRGMLFGGLRERLPRMAAALVTGVIFGGLHALTGVSAVPPLIVFGFLLSLLYEKTGSIVPGILLHMLNNSVALLGQ
ncbi:MAG: lysostaphin resistance A-like protein [Solirubrobacterales bacterium]